MEFEYPDGATPLDSDEIAGLIPRYLQTQKELNFSKKSSYINS